MGFLNYTGAVDGTDPLSARMQAAEAYGFDYLKFASISPDLIALDQFTMPQHQTVLRFWLGCGRIGGLPASVEIDPFKIREALGFIQVLEPNEGFSDLYYRLYGTKLVGVVGDDFTGLWVSEVPVGIRALMLDQYLAACVQRRPIYSENDTKAEFSIATRLCRLTLPMVGGDGVVDRVIVSSAPCPRPG
jgi:hypothetical protein